MEKVLYALLFTIGTILFSSCNLTFNPKARSGKARKYPKFTRADSLRGTLSPERSCFDVHYYDLTIEPLPEKKALKGEVETRFSMLAASDKIQLDLAPNLKIDSILLNNESLHFTREARAVFIRLPQVYEAGKMLSIRINYHGSPQIAKKAPWEGGLVWKEDKNQKPWLGVACEDDGASIWWPMKDHISDEPDSVGINIIVDKGLMGVANGRLIEKKDAGNGKDIFRWRTSYPVNTYNITFYVGDFEKLTIPYSHDSVSYLLDFYVLPYSKQKAEEHFQQCVDILNFYEQAFGEYPWWKDGYKLVESPFAGMEHQTAIAYGNNYKNISSLNFDYIILHETAHEWWGNSLTAPDMAELWLHEGFATYSEALYVEEKFGYKAYINYLLLYRLTIKNKRPLIGPYKVTYSNYKDGDIYTKGAWFLHSLRFAINNDSLFKDIIKTFAVTYRQKTVSTQDFLDLVNQKTGKDYEWVFRQYLYNRKAPQLVYNFSATYKGTIINYKWKDVVDGFEMPVILRHGGKNEKIYPEKEFQTLRIDEPYFSFPYYPCYFGHKKGRK